MIKLVDEDYPDRDRIVLVMDNLNTCPRYTRHSSLLRRGVAERLEIIPNTGVG